MGYEGGSLADLFDPGPTRRAARELADLGGDTLHEFVVRNTPIDSGNLRSSWARVPTLPGVRGTNPTYESRVVTEVEYAPYVEHGTGLYGPEHRKYLIEPRHPGGMLRWMSGGQEHFARRVWHPGSPGAHMMAAALAKTEVEWANRTGSVMERWKRATEGLV